MNFHIPIPHKPRQWSEVRGTLQWSLSGHQDVCISYPLEGKRQHKKTQNWRSSKLNQYLSYKPHSSFKPTWICFEDFVCVFQMVLLTKNMLVLEAHNKDRKSTRDKENICSPIVNRGCPPLTANRRLWKIHLDLQYNIFHWGSTILGVSTL